MLSVGVWYVSSYRENRLAKLELDALGNNHALLLENGIKEYIGKIAALGALFESSDQVRRDEFQTFANAILQDQAAILAVCWIPRISRDQRAAHELEGVAQGLPGYRIKSAMADGSLQPAADLPEHFPMFYSSKEPPVLAVYGLDLADGGVWQQTLERARDNGRIAVSGGFPLRSSDGDRNGFFVVMPVYRPGRAHDTVSART